MLPWTDILLLRSETMILVLVIGMTLTFFEVNTTER